MKAADVSQAVAAATAVATRCNLRADQATVLHCSNRVALRLSRCDALARVARAGRGGAQLEVDVARRLAELQGCPVAALDPRVEPRVHEHDGFTVTLWTYHHPLTPPEVSPADYATALAKLHAGMRKVSLEVPHFTDRVTEAQALVSSRERTPALGDEDRELLADTLGRLRQAVVDHRADEQLLHGEPHPGNVLRTEAGPLFIDLETCCRGPVEFDLAHAPEEVADHYPHADPALLLDCRGLSLAMVAAWRWDRDDEFPDGRREGHELVRAIRRGPPWRALGD
ncbi:MAG: aminoglycoside phosphotransferase family protein [Myxococcota bacterium]|nr:aminoglycoside phosphotransferase family protein [Myxococcota bacterium]